MLAKRVLVAAILLPIGLVLIYIGGIAYSLFIGLVMLLAAWEYDRMMHQVNHQPATILVLIGVAALCAARAWNGFELAPAILSVFVLVAMGYHLFTFERGRDKAATDFASTLGIVLYLGWIGAYLISLRALENGMHWLLLTFLIIWIADSAAYFIGGRWGRHRLSPRLSPKKSWEGYWAGVVFGTLAGVLVGWGFSAWVGTASGISWSSGLVLGLVLSVVTTLGDLGESMIKRQAGVKDSGNLLPGHGGAFDRVDSWLWAGVIAYYFIVWFFI